MVDSQREGEEFPDSQTPPLALWWNLSLILPHLKQHKSFLLVSPFWHPVFGQRHFPSSFLALRLPGLFPCPLRLVALSFSPHSSGTGAQKCFAGGRATQPPEHCPYLKPNQTSPPPVFSCQTSRVKCLIPSVWCVTSRHSWEKSRRVTRACMSCVFSCWYIPSQPSCLLPCIPGACGGTWIIKTLTFLMRLKWEKHSSYKRTRETWEFKTNRLTSGSSAGI